MRYVIDCIDNGTFSPARLMQFHGSSINTMDFVIACFMLALTFAAVSQYMERTSPANKSGGCALVVVIAVISMVAVIALSVTNSPASRFVFLVLLVDFLLLLIWGISAIWAYVKQHFIRACRVDWAIAKPSAFDSGRQLKEKFHDWICLPVCMGLVFLFLISITSVWYSYSKPTRLKGIVQRMEAVNRKKQSQVFPVGYGEHISFMLFLNHIDPDVLSAWNVRVLQHLAASIPDARCKGLSSLLFFSNKREGGLYCITVFFLYERNGGTHDHRFDYAAAHLPVPEERMLQMVEKHLATQHPEIHKQLTAREKRIPIIGSLLFGVLIGGGALSFGTYFSLVWLKYRKIKQERDRIASQIEAEARRRREEQDRQCRQEEYRRQAELARRQATIEEQERKRREWEEAPKQRRCRKCDFVFPEYSIPRCPKCNSSDFEVILV